MPNRTSETYCVIGAGASGLAVAKNLAARNIPFDCLEREGDIGGLWNIATGSGAVYETAHLISSISSTGFDDLPMLDEDYPEYPSHERVLGYFRDYSGTFGLDEHIELGKIVMRVAPSDDGTWEVQVAGEQTPRSYRGVIIASGHHDIPRMPSYPGEFSGEVLHSRQYKSPKQVRDRRVLIVGCGNSAADIVSDAVHGGSVVFLSMRRGYWFVPKFLLGFPTGDMVSILEMFPIPRVLKRWLFEAGLWLLQGPPARYRLPNPDYSIDQAHPTMTDEIPRLVAHGDLTVKPEIAGYDGDRVIFRDGTSEKIDVLVFATGYQATLPFIDRNLIFDASGRSRLYLRVFHPEHEGLFAAGLVQGNGSMWRLADYQSNLIANYIVARERAPERARQFRAILASRRFEPAAGDFVGSDRHKLEVNYYDYRRTLKRLIRHFGRVRKLSFAVADGRASPTLTANAASQRAEAEAVR